MKKYITIMMSLFSFWSYSQTKNITRTDCGGASPIEKKENNNKVSLFDYAISKKDFKILIELIENGSQDVIDKIEEKSNFSYEIFEKMPVSIKVDKALEALEKNNLKGNIYRELKKSLKKHIKRQKKNPAN